MKRFALLSYTNTANLGDEIQSIAARGFLPRVDAFIDRENLHAFRADDGAQYWTILNGWFCHFPEHWPPSPQIRPLPVSLHISPDAGAAGGVGLTAADVLLCEPFKPYLRGFGPVGARDLPTLKRLRDAGVDAYFSGCMTLTLQRPEVARDDGVLVLNDVPPQVASVIQRSTGRRIVETAHWNDSNDRAARFGLAERLLETYAGAGCVITTRLHCALPCVAMGTPVLLLDTAADQHRFAGLHELVRHCTVADFLAGASGFDIDTPGPNGQDHIPLVEALRARVTAFVQQPELPRATYPLSAEQMQSGLRLVIERTAGVVYRQRAELNALKQQAKRAPADAAAAAEAPALLDLMRRFESLGENCEFGLVQRRCGYEPLGLLRFASAPYGLLLRALRERFSGMAAPDMLAVELSENGREYMVQDRRFGFLYHAWVKAGEAAPADIVKREHQRVPLLVRKLLEDLADGAKIFVYRSMIPLTEAQARDLAAAIRGCGPGTLLWLERADAAHPAGSVQWVAPGLLKGHIDRFAPGENAHDFSLDCWIEVCRSAARLADEAQAASTRAPAMA